ncbi:MAG: DNA repair protein RecO C-terminal domain-containing protein, partial [Steroidobacteraceae bacterium]
LMAGYYLNELLLKLTTRHDPAADLYDDYDQAIALLKSRAALEATLRVFEKRLLDHLGYGVNLREEAANGRPVRAAAYYYFRPTQGLTPTVADAVGAYAGRSLLSLAAERLDDERALDDARRLLRSMLEHCLEGRELATRVVARSMLRRKERGAS